MHAQLAAQEQLRPHKQEHLCVRVLIEQHKLTADRFTAGTPSLLHKLCKRNSRGGCH